MSSFFDSSFSRKKQSSLSPGFLLNPNPPRSMGLFAAKKGFQQTMTKKVESLESLVSALATQNQEVS